MNPSKRTAILALTAALALVGCNRAGHTPDNNPDNSGTLPAESLNLPTAERDAQPAADTTANNETRANESEYGPILATPGPQVSEKQNVEQPAQQPAAETKQVQSEPSTLKTTAHTTQQKQDQQAQPRGGVFNYAGEKLQSWYNWSASTVYAIGAWFGYKSSVAYHAVRPNEKTVGRRDALAVHHDRITDTRAAEATELGALKDKIGQLSPNTARVEGIIRPNNETKRQLARVLTEQNPENVAGAAERLVDDIFKTPDTADGKVLQIQLALRELAANDAYGEAESARVIYLQTELDKHIAADNASSAALRYGTIALISAASGVYVGANGIERTARTLEVVPVKVKKIFAKGEQIVEGEGAAVVNAGSSKLNKVASKAGAVVKDARVGIAGAVAKLRGKLVSVSPKDVMIRDLTRMFEHTGQYTRAEAEALVKRLDIKRASPRLVTSLDSNATEEVLRDVSPTLLADEASDAAVSTASKATAIPQIQVKLEQTLKGLKSEDGQYFVTFYKTAVTKKLKKPTTEFYHSAGIPSQEAADLATLLAKDAPKREIQVVAHVDGQTVPASAEDTAALLETQRVADTTAVDGGEAVLGKDSTLVIEGKPALDPAASADEIKNEIVANNGDVEKLVNDTKAGLESGVAAVADAADKGAEVVVANSKKTWARTKDAGVATKNWVINEKNNFDPVKGAIGAGLVGIPMIIAERAGYFQGHRHGEGYDALYLEDLIPPNRLQRVIIKSDGSSRTAE